MKRLEYHSTIFSWPVYMPSSGIGRVAADPRITEGDAPPGCCVITSIGRCGKPGKKRAIGCTHEHVWPGEICDACAKFLPHVQCGACLKSSEPHTCRLFVMEVPP